MIRILAVGDVVGRPGRIALAHFLPLLKKEREIDVVVVNAENSAAGAGINEKIYREIRALGADVVTMGDHAFDKREAFPLYEREERLLRPANWPKSAPGRGTCLFEGPRGIRVGVVHLQGRVFMNAWGDFFEEAERAVASLKEHTNVVIVDMHAEATSEKIALSWFLDGRISLLFGTHTHVPTADEQILPGGTAFQCDVGMCGPYDSILGRRIDRVLGTAITFMPSSFDVATGDVRLSGAIVDVDDTTSLAAGIKRMQWKDA